MPTTTNKGQDKQDSKKVEVCLKALKGMSVHDAKKFLFTLMDIIDKKTKVV